MSGTLAAMGLGTPLTPELVRAAYALILGREPESQAAIDFHLRLADVKTLGEVLLNSREFQLRQPPRPHEHQVFAGYGPGDRAILDAFTPWQGTAPPDRYVNWLGVSVRTAFVRSTLPFGGMVEGRPEPVGSLQGETAEWIAVLRSVLAAAPGRYAMLELGAGYGPWMAITACAARQRGIGRLRLYGVEGDADRCAFLHTHMRDNGIAPESYVALHGAVGKAAGTVEWGVAPEAAQHYGARPLEAGLVDYAGIAHVATRRLPMLGIEELLRREPQWDLVHLDIQGGEAEVCRAGIKAMEECVRRVVIGTHSRALDGEVMRLFHDAGWVLEAEKPAVMQWRAGTALEALTTVDGLQAWRNPRLAGEVPG
ncbi:class I SAM-dependent methyltransferase [Siccirubricoccus phaeus]|uniref:hypothetical protein n=1 Tax=Siccirubricoccus phaeus TaxID=2595053 RepID=UPI0011F24147|nr:hypothetical protein [Siccirubricoccus phaeus]